jgi:TRAP-type transport system periplasmic protein
LSSEGLKGFKLADLIKYNVASWKYSPIHAFYLIFNKKKWDSLPPDVKKVFTELAKEYSDKLGVAWNELDVEGIETMKAQGGQEIEIAASEHPKWAKAVEPLIGEYKKEMVGKGYKTDEVDSWFTFIQERIEYWKGQEKARKIPTAYKY